MLDTTTTTDTNRIFQWQWLIDTQNVADQEDTKSVFDILRNQIINKNLSDVQLTILLRRIRSINNPSSTVLEIESIIKLLPKDTPILQNLILLVQSLTTHNPVGISFSAFATIIGIAYSKNREQRLQLLFYLFCDTDYLKQILQNNDNEKKRNEKRKLATWLLEVGQNESISIDTLMHYNTHGTVFLPVNDMTRPTFVPDPTQSPILVHASRVCNIVRDCLVEDSRKSMSTSTTENLEDPVDLMQYLHKVSDNFYHDEPYDVESTESLYNKISTVNDESEIIMWTVEEFAEWAEEVLVDDRILDILFYKLILQGILPSPFMEFNIVRKCWIKWQKEQQSALCLKSSSSNNNNAFDDEPHKIGFINDVNFLYCVDKTWWDMWTLYVGFSFHDGESSSNIPKRSHYQRRPPPISNQLPWNTTSHFHHGVKVGTWNGEDYEYVPPPVWECLYELYGGGPPVPCTLLPIVSNGKSIQIECRQDFSTVSPIDDIIPSKFGVCGLKNLGKSAWMNVMIQCLNAAPLFRAYLLSNMHSLSSHMNRNDPLGSGGRIIESLAKAMTAMRRTKHGAYEPAVLGSVIARTNPQFRSTLPQDVFEFFEFLVDVLHGDSNLVRKKPYVKALDDEWAENNSLRDIHSAQWRRYLRRNRSFISDLATGTSLSLVSCSVCGYTSKQFEQFSALSLPIAASNKVLFVCTLVRRGSLLEADPATDSGRPLYTTYMIEVPRLADNSEIGKKLSILCGFPVDRLQIYILKSAVQEKGQETKLVPLPKNCPAAQGESPSDPNSDHPIDLIVFETTLNTRTSELVNGKGPKELLSMYGDSRECRIVDTNPLPLAKAVSVRQFSQLQKQCAVGVRVDGQDSRGGWYPGTIVQTFGPKNRFRIHFDNYDEKWDEEYGVADIGVKVKPLHSQSKPLLRNRELLVYNFVKCEEEWDRFGHDFYLDFFNEWSCARAGAHILVQACRFLRILGSEDELEHIIRESLVAVSEFVDLLIRYDKESIHHILSNEDSKNFVSSVFQQRLQDEVPKFLERLPFQIFIADNRLGPKAFKSAKPFPFSLQKTVGNFLTLRNMIILQWTQQSGSTSQMVLYRRPKWFIHESHHNYVKNLNMEKKSGTGVSVSSCMDAFCEPERIPDISGYGWVCKSCNDVRPCAKSISLWHLPDILTIRIKRFNMSAEWFEKLNTLVNYPVIGLDLGPWCHKDIAHENNIYDLIGVIDHHRIRKGVGHYTATIKATACAPNGTEETVYNFSGGKFCLSTNNSNDQSINGSMWLHIDDEIVKSIPADQVITNKAYMLMYRRRQLTPSNVAKYSSLLK